MARVITQARRSFSDADRIAFAELSGDWSLPAGSSSVHALHLVTWALDQLVESRVWLDRVIAWFTRPVRVGGEVELEASESSCVIRQSGEIVVEITYELASFNADFDLETPSEKWPRKQPLDVPQDQLSDTPEMIQLVLDRELAMAIAPNLAAHVAAVQLAELIATSRIVGMHGPGTAATITLVKLTARPGWSLASIGFQVSPVERRADHVALSIAGPTLVGHVEASLRST